jgi:membrane fusion protein (multidrug efflux system)
MKNCSTHAKTNLNDKLDFVLSNCKTQLNCLIIAVSIYKKKLTKALYLISLACKTEVLNVAFLLKCSQARVIKQGTVFFLDKCNQMLTFKLACKLKVKSLINSLFIFKKDIINGLISSLLAYKLEINTLIITLSARKAKIVNEFASFPTLCRKVLKLKINNFAHALSTFKTNIINGLTSPIIACKMACKTKICNTNYALRTFSSNIVHDFYSFLLTCLKEIISAILSCKSSFKKRFIILINVLMSVETKTIQAFDSIFLAGNFLSKAKLNKLVVIIASTLKTKSNSKTHGSDCSILNCMPTSKAKTKRTKNIVYALATYQSNTVNGFVNSIQACFNTFLTVIFACKLSCKTKTNNAIDSLITLRSNIVKSIISTIQACINKFASIIQSFINAFVFVFLVGKQGCKTIAKNTINTITTFKLNIKLTIIKVINKFVPAIKTCITYPIRFISTTRSYLSSCQLACKRKINNFTFAFAALNAKINIKFVSILIIGLLAIGYFSKSANALKSLKAENSSPTLKANSESLQKSNNPTSSEKPTNVPAASQYITDTEPSLPIYVMVHSRNNTTFSSETTATIRFISSREGDNFQAGSTLIEFDCRVSQAELKKALAQEQFAKSAYKSATKLQSYGSISESELIKAKSEAEIASSEVEKLTAIIDKCTIKAPYNGAVSESLVQVGETVKPGDPLIKTVNIDNLELQMQIPSTWLRWLHIGSEFKVTITELNKTFSAKVEKINPEINSVSQTVKIVGILSSPESGLLPGMSGQATFPEVASNKDIPKQ